MSIGTDNWDIGEEIDGGIETGATGKEHEGEIFVLVGEGRDWWLVEEIGKGSKGLCTVGKTILIKMCWGTEEFWVK